MAFGSNDKTIPKKVDYGMFEDIDLVKVSDDQYKFVLDYPDDDPLNKVEFFFNKRYLAKLALKTPAAGILGASK